MIHDMYNFDLTEFYQFIILLCINKIFTNVRMIYQRVFYKTETQ